MMTAKKTLSHKYSKQQNILGTIEKTKKNPQKPGFFPEFTENLKAIDSNAMH